MKSEPEAIAGTHTDPLKPPPKRVEEASEMELFDALKAIFAGEEPNLILEEPPRKGGMFRAECAMMLQDLNPPVYQELNRTGALDEYLDLASHGNRDLYLSGIIYNSKHRRPRVVPGPGVTLPVGADRPAGG